MPRPPCPRLLQIAACCESSRPLGGPYDTAILAARVVAAEIMPSPVQLACQSQQQQQQQPQHKGGALKPVRRSSMLHFRRGQVGSTSLAA